MQKALLQGYFGYGNVGDEAICSVILEELRTRFIKSIILSINPKRTTSLHGAESCREKFASLNFIRHFLESQTLIFAGGGRYGRRTIRRMCVLTLVAKILGKKVECRALGVYPYEWDASTTIMNIPEPFYDMLTRVLLLASFSLVDRINVRDEFSKQVLLLSGVRKAIEVEDDLALQLKAATPKTSLQVLAQHEVNVGHKPLVGVNLRTMRPEINKRVVEESSKFLDMIIENYDAEVVFLGFGYGSRPERFFDNDLLIADELKNSMKNAIKLKIIRKEYSPQNVLGTFRYFDLFIGMRFHSILFSIMMGTPTVAIVYDTKQIEFLRARAKVRGHNTRAIPVNVLTKEKLLDAVSFHMFKARTREKYSKNVVAI